MGPSGGSVSAFAFGADGRIFSGSRGAGCSPPTTAGTRGCDAATACRPTCRCRTSRRGPGAGSPTCRRGPTVPTAAPTTAPPGTGSPRWPPSTTWPSTPPTPTRSSSLERQRPAPQHRRRGVVGHAHRAERPAGAGRGRRDRPVPPRHGLPRRRDPPAQHRRRRHVDRAGTELHDRGGRRGRPLRPGHRLRLRPLRGRSPNHGRRRPLEPARPARVRHGRDRGRPHRPGHRVGGHLGRRDRLPLVRPRSTWDQLRVPGARHAAPGGPGRPRRARLGRRGEPGADRQRGRRRVVAAATHRLPRVRHPRTRGPDAGTGAGGHLRRRDPAVHRRRDDLALVRDRGGRLRTLIAQPGNPEVVVAGADRGTFRSADGGATWDRVASFPATDVVFSPAAGARLRRVHRRLGPHRRRWPHLAAAPFPWGSTAPPRSWCTPPGRRGSG